MKFIQKDDRQMVKYIPLGGVGEVNRQMHVYEFGGDIVAVDCGLGFPDRTMPGIDYLIPDISYLEENIARLRAIIITHGHEDHMGALPIILKRLAVPLYATPLVKGMIQIKLTANGVSADLRAIDVDSPLKIGGLELEFFRVNHSVPDSVGICLKTPFGNIIHAPDYKFDWTPVDGLVTEVGKLVRFGGEGVLCLLSDSLRVERPGYTLSEKMIEESFEREMRRVKGRIFITTFASNISRIQQAVNASVKFNRRVTFASKTMEQYFFMAQELGYARISPKMFVPIRKASSVPDHNLTVVASGSQGEPDAALTKISHGAHKFLDIKKGDTIVFASDPIPGNEEAVRHTIDLLTVLGAKVLYSDILDDLHVSGHASREELKLMIGLTKPRCLIPIGGTPVMAKLYQEMAVEMGYEEGEVLLLPAGQSVEFGESGAKLGKKYHLKNVMVDGLGVGDIGRIVLRDREALAKEGILIVVVPLDAELRTLAGKIEVISKGFVFEKEDSGILDKCRALTEEVLQKQRERGKHTDYLREAIEEQLENHIYEKLGRTPMIVPVVVEF